MGNDKKSLNTIYTPVLKGLTLVEKEISRQLTSDDEFIYRLNESVLISKGKRLRPALVLLSTGTKDKTDIRLIKLAASIELIHNATLLHDDVIDQTPLRRGKVSAPSLWGTELSILLGDYLYAKAFILVAGLKSPEVASSLAEVTHAMCEGEMTEVNHRHNLRLKEEDYLTIIRQKTACLISACCRNGAFLSGTNLSKSRTLEDYGLNFGMAFQIVDDCLDIVGEEDELGKSLGTDIQNGKLTLPYIFLLNNRKRSIQIETETLLQKNNGRETFRRLKELVIEEEAISYSLDRAKEYAVQAKRRLKELNSLPYQRNLADLVDFAIERRN